MWKFEQNRSINEEREDRGRTYTGVFIQCTHLTPVRFVTRELKPPASGFGGYFYRSGAARVRYASLRSTPLHRSRPTIASGFGTHLKTSPQPPFAPPFRPELLYRYLLLRGLLYLIEFLYAFSFLSLSFKIHNNHTIKVLHVNEIKIYYINLSFDVIYFLSFTWIH